ncbi:MAG: transporter [Sterolibacterium sp.]|jgi:hypothetical protein|nr:transporter [Sterolibacterium sp.]
MRFLSWGLFSLALLPLASADAIDLLPGEGQAPPPGLNYFQLIHQQSERGDLYRHGQKLRSDTRISAAQTQVRLGHAFTIGKQPAYLCLQAPLDVRIVPKGALSGAGSVAGAGDLTAYLAYWPYANRQTQSYFGVVGYVTAPTGAYDRNRSLNPGSNRWSGDLQIGYQQPVLDRLTLMLVADVLWSGKNNDYGRASDTLQQGAIYATQTSLRYDFNPAYSLGISYLVNAGGKTTVNGVERDDRLQVYRYQVVGSATYSFGKIVVQYGGDLETSTGYFENSRWLVRYIRTF